MSPQTLNKQEHKWASDMARHLNLNFAEEGGDPGNEQQQAANVSSIEDPWETLAALERSTDELFANNNLVKNQSVIFAPFKKAGQSARSVVASAKKDLKGRKAQSANAKIAKIKENIASMEQLIAVAKSNHTALEGQIPWIREDYERLAAEIPIVDSLAIAKKIPSKKHKKFIGIDQEARSLLREAETSCENFQVDAANKLLKSLHKTLQNYQKEVDWLQTLPAVSGFGASETPHTSKRDKIAAAFHRKQPEDPNVELVRPEATEKTKVFIQSWKKENFTDPSARKDLQKRGGASAPFKFVVHTGSMENLINQTGCFASDANDTMKGWDTICTSVVTDEKCFAYGAFGVILDVPPQNVLVSSPDDIMSDLNIGRADRKEHMVNVTQEQNEKLLDVPDHVRNGYLKNHLGKFDYDKRQQPVDDLMENTYHQHNEVIISTKEGVQHKEGVDATAPLKIQGIFMIDSEPSPDTVAVQKFNGKEALSKEEKYELFMKHAEKVAKSLGVPILFLDGESTTA
ncbi:hypothetical protein [Pseudovibrio sp. Alg231-02]|uniref:hypothetical protein n=1 Tax=Pseudovibrio sp. Alg231-02 TaxID=1922223 RepID=UPI000D55A37B|nr:hypothetical protein [Pseudovibrio sp. Alg231-02]